MITMMIKIIDNFIKYDIKDNSNNNNNNNNNNTAFKYFTYALPALGPKCTLNELTFEVYLDHYECFI